MLLLCCSMLQNPEDKPRFEEFYNTYYDTIYYVARQHLKTNESAEDCAQEIMMHFAKEFHNITQDIYDKKFRNYVIVVSKGMSVDMYRKEKKHFKNVVDADISDSYNIGEEDFDDFDMMLLKEAVDKLPEPTREVFYLKYVFQYSGADISRILNMSEPMVRKRCMLGKRFVKNYIKGDENNE